KIRGFRIELGEIEARLVEHELVKEAVVLALGEGGDKRLVAYVAADYHENLAHTLREYLATTMPEYMVPAAFVRLDILPVTNNGKVNRRALPKPDSSAFAAQGYEEPRGEVETALATIWAQLLKMERVGRNDNFFMLGGHSLLAVQMIEQLRRIDLAVELLDRYLVAIQQIVDRHDILRTAIVSQNMSVPAQVVLRKATISVTELTLDPADGSISDQLMQRYDTRKYRIEMHEAPLARFVFAQDVDGRYVMAQLIHHIIGDHSTMKIMDDEIEKILAGQGDTLAEPQPYRNLIAQVRMGKSVEEHE
ncbi:hypothetical protein BGZ72_002881, partial [Mortierella alpina]